MSSSEWIFKNSEFVGDFESLYQNVEDPWDQSQTGPGRDSRRALALALCERYRGSGFAMTTVELGCGFGLLTSELHNRGFNAHGVDISPSAIQHARSRSAGTFHHFDVTDFAEIEKFNPDIIIMCEITWYILPKLRLLIDEIKSYARISKKPVYIFHSLTTYPQGVQKYGLEYFSNLEEILDFFGLEYIESGIIYKFEGTRSYGTYFFALVHSS